MNGSDMRSKAAAMFGKNFMAEAKAKPLAKNAAVASNKVSKDRPIPAFKVGGVVKRMPFDVKPEDEGVTGGKNTPLDKTRKETVAKAATENAKNAGKPVKKVDGGRIGTRIMPISMRNPETMGAGSGIGDMRASLGGVGGSMRPDYSGMQGRMMRDLDRESRMTGEAGTPRGVGLRVGARFKDGGKVDKEKAATKPGSKASYNPPKAKAGDVLDSVVRATKIGGLEKKNGSYVATSDLSPEDKKKVDKLAQMRGPLTNPSPALRQLSEVIIGRKAADVQKEINNIYSASGQGKPTDKPVKKATGGKVQTSADTAKKLATEMGGMKCGGKAGKYAAGGAGKMRKGQCDTPTKLAKGGAGKVRKGMMTQKGEMLQAVKPGKGIGGK